MLAPPEMPRKSRYEGLVQFNIRMPSDLLEALDAEVGEELRAHPGRMFTRSDLIREVLYRHVEGRRVVGSETVGELPERVVELDLTATRPGDRRRST